MITHSSNNCTFDTLNKNVPALAQWIIHADPLLNCEKEYESGELIGGPGRGGDLWKGMHGFCRERWNLWKDRLEWVQQQPEVAGKTKTMAKRAVEIMNTL